MLARGHSIRVSSVALSSIPHGGRRNDQSQWPVGLDMNRQPFRKQLSSNHTLRRGIEVRHAVRVRSIWFDRKPLGHAIHLTRFQ
jgi:hypothetical protein